MSNKTRTSGSKSITIRCPENLLASIEQQVKATQDSKTDVIVRMLYSSLPSVKITERTKLPESAGIYFVYTDTHKLLHIGKADNLKTRWNSHHKYQSFIEACVNSRIGYFVVDDLDELEKIVEDFALESVQTTNRSFVTYDKLQLVEQKLSEVETQYQTISAAMSKLGMENVNKRLELALPPRGLQDWSPEPSEALYGIIPSTMMKRVGFGSTLEFEKAAKVFELEEVEYLEELSGWVLADVKGLAPITKLSKRYYLAQHDYDSLFNSIFDWLENEEPIEADEAEQLDGLSAEQLCARLDISLDQLKYFAYAHGDVDISECLYLMTQWKLGEDDDSFDLYLPANLTLERREIMQETDQIRQKIYRKPTKS